MSGLIIAQSLLRVRINALLRFPEPFCIVLSVHQAVEECEKPPAFGHNPASKCSSLSTVGGGAFLNFIVIPVCFVLGWIALMQSCLAATPSNMHRSVSTGARHVSQRNILQKTAEVPCYQSQAGLIFLKAPPGKSHMGHSNNFAPIGEAVFRSSTSQHACVAGRGRRG